MLVSREIEGHCAIIPVWHNVTRAKVSAFSPTLADLRAVRTSDGAAIDIALQLLAVIRPDIYAKYPRAQLEKLANVADLQEELTSLREQLSEFQCPYCKSQLVGSIEAPIDPEEKHWDNLQTFACGYRVFGSLEQRLCPSDPRYPKFQEYELLYHEQGQGSPHARWICNAMPKTEAARLVLLPQTFGPTKAQAAAVMAREYEQRAAPWMRPLGEPL